RYDSPSFNGLTFSGQVAVRDSSGPTDVNGGHAQELRHAYVLGGNVIYNNGPIQVGAAFERHLKVRFADTDDTEITATGGYNFGIVRVAAVYEYLKYEIARAQGRGDL